MEIKHLKYALEIARVGSITQASKNLFVAQPNLSKIVKELEEEIGITIFIRSIKGVHLTAEGKEFLDYSKDIIHQFDSLQSFYNKDRQDFFTLSISSTRASYVCASIIALLNKQTLKNMSMHVRFREGTNFEVLNDVAGGNSDLGIIRYNDSNSEYFLNLSKSRSLKSMPISINKYVVLMSKNHPLAKHEIVTCKDLQNYIEVRYGDYEFTTFLFQDEMKMKLSPKKSIITVYDRGSLLDIVANVENTYMWTTSTHSKILNIYNLIEKKSDLFEEECVDIVIYKDEKPFNDIINEFIQIIEEVIANN